MNIGRVTEILHVAVLIKNMEKLSSIENDNERNQIAICEIIIRIQTFSRSGGLMRSEYFSCF